MRNQKLQGTAHDKRCQRRIYKRSDQPKKCMKTSNRLQGFTFLRYTVLTSPKKCETAVHCCDPTLSVLVMLVSRNVFHVVSALQSIAYQISHFANANIS